MKIMFFHTHAYLVMIDKISDPSLPPPHKKTFYDYNLDAFIVMTMISYTNFFFFWTVFSTGGQIIHYQEFLKFFKSMLKVMILFLVKKKT